MICAMYIGENILELILKKMKYTDIDESKIQRGHYTRQVNILSSIITFILATSAYMEHGYTLQLPDTCDSIRSHDINRSIWSILLVTSYFLYDALAHRLTVEYYLHHFAGLIPLVLIVFTQNNYGMYLASIGLLVEFSSIIMNFIFITTGKTKRFFRYLFFVVFIVVRPIYMTYILAMIFKCRPESYVEYLIGAGFLFEYLLNLKWFVMLCGKLQKDLCGSSRDKKSN